MPLYYSGQNDTNARYCYTTRDSDTHLAHGVEWKNHKYIKKIGEGARALYFYTLGELKSYLRSQQNMIKNKAGADEKARHQQAQQNLREANKRVESAYRNPGKPGPSQNQNKQQEISAAKKNQAQARQEAEAAEKEYRSTLIGRIDSAKDAREKEITKRENNAMESRVGKIRGEFHKIHQVDQPGADNKSIWLEVDPVLQSNGKKMEAELNSLLKDYKKSTDKEERKKLEKSISNLEKAVNQMYRDAEKFSRSKEGKEIYLEADARYDDLRRAEKALMDARKSNNKFSIERAKKARDEAEKAYQDAAKKLRDASPVAEWDSNNTAQESNAKSLVEIFVEKGRDAVSAVRKELDKAGSEINKAVENLKNGAEESVEKFKKAATDYWKKSDAIVQESDEAVTRAVRELNSSERPSGREQNVTGSGEGKIFRRGEALDTGPVGNTDPGNFETEKRNAQMVDMMYARANELVDTNIQVNPDDSPYNQIVDYVNEVNRKLNEMAVSDTDAARKYQKEQSFVIGAMAADQYYQLRDSYEAAKAVEDELLERVDSSAKEYLDAQKEFDKNQADMTSEQRKAAEDQLEWKKAAMNTSAENWQRHINACNAYQHDMKVYEDILNSIIGSLETLNDSQKR